jgi:hypothetical protein
LQTEHPLRPSNSDLANPNLSANGGRLLATADGVTARAAPASSHRPHLLFVTEKWCDGNPQAGVTNNEHNLFGSLDVAGMATHERLHLDEYRLQHGRNCDEELIHRCRTRRPTAIIACYLFCSTLNVSHDTWKQIHEMRIPVVFIWFDAVLKPRMQLADSLAPFAALSLVLDTAAYNTGFPDRYMPMWTPQDTRYFFNPHRARDIDVCFLGSMAGYADRQAGIAALRNCGIEVFQKGGQREQALPLQDYAGVLQRSKICLNFPRMRGDPTLVQAKGRIFEATLCGALLLDAENDQTRRWFTPLEEYDSFADEEDLVKKVRYYLGNEVERTTLANRGWIKATTVYHPRKFWQSVFQTLGVFTGDFPC